MKKVLVTGGAGFIGYHLSKYLASRHYDVTILDNFERSQADTELKDILKLDNVKFLKVDVTLPQTFTNLSDEYDYVYHLAAINGTENFYKIPDRVLKVGILGTINILDWFITQKKGKFLFTSSSEVYAGALNLLKERFPIPTPEEIPLVVEDPKNVRWCYAAGKIIGEVAIYSYAKVHRMNNFAIIRYHNIYGPRMGFHHVIPQFIRRIVQKENPFRIFGGEETRTFCYVDDAIRATQIVMESKQTNGQIIHIGRSDGEIKIIDLAKMLFEVAGVNPTIKIESSPEGCVMRRCPDTSKLRKLGFSARVDLKEGLGYCYEWYKNRYNNEDMVQNK